MITFCNLFKYSDHFELHWSVSRFSNSNSVDSYFKYFSYFTDAFQFATEILHIYSSDINIIDKSDFNFVKSNISTPGYQFSIFDYIYD